MRYILVLIMFFITAVIAHAQILPDTIFAVTPHHINSKNIKINQTIPLIVFNSDNSKGDIVKKKMIYIKILQYVKPKRGKRDGYYKVEYNSDVKLSGKMRASTPKDMKNITEEAGIIIAGHILKIPGFSQAVAVSKGLITPNENENRLQSAGKNLYESTPLTYIEKGKDFDIESDGIVVLKLKEKNSQRK